MIEITETMRRYMRAHSTVVLADSLSEATQEQLEELEAAARAVREEIAAEEDTILSTKK